jgi:hypothetical protein
MDEKASRKLPPSGPELTPEQRDFLARWELLMDWHGLAEKFLYPEPDSITALVGRLQNRRAPS